MIEDRRQVQRRDGGRFEHVAWWYGPEHGWGNTWGPLDGSVVVFELYGHALEAAGSVGLALGHSKHCETLIRKIEQAERDERDRVTKRLIEYDERGLDHPQAEQVIDANRERLRELDAAIALRGGS